MAPDGRDVTRITRNRPRQVEAAAQPPPRRPDRPLLTPAERERAFLESMAADLAEIRPMEADFARRMGLSP